MHILAFLLLFVVGAILAACNGDYSGIAAIGKFVGFFVLLFAVLWLFTQPVLLIIAIVGLVLIVIYCFSKQRWFYDYVCTIDRTQSKERMVLSYDDEKDVANSGMSFDEYIKKVLAMNPEFERVYCR